MNRIDEFTSVCAIPAVGAAGKAMPTGAGARRKKKRASVDEFLAVPAHAPTPAVSEAAPAAPSPVPAPPAVAAPAPAAPAPVVEAAPTSALMVSREVVEALAAGRSVSVRGILLEPTFKPGAVAAPVAPAAPAMEGAAAAFAARVVTESAPSGEPVNMHAPQPPPAPPSDGRAVSGSFRRFAGSMAT